MPSDLLVITLSEGTLFVGSTKQLAVVAGASEVNTGFDFVGTLMRHAEGWRLHHAAADWGLPSFGRLTRPKREQIEQIGTLLETGRLSARFVPLFRADPRGPSETGPLRVYQIGRGPPPAAPRAGAAVRIGLASAAPHDRPIAARASAEGF